MPDGVAAGLKILPLTPFPVNVPPVGVAVKLMSASPEQYEVFKTDVIFTCGAATVVVITVSLFEQLCESVYW